MKRAIREMDSGDLADNMRAGKLMLVLWLFINWVVKSELAWIITGRHPRWSAHRWSP